MIVNPVASIAERYQKLSADIHEILGQEDLSDSEKLQKILPLLEVSPLGDDEEAVRNMLGHHRDLAGMHKLTHLTDSRRLKEIGWAAARMGVWASTVSD